MTQQERPTSHTVLTLALIGIVFIIVALSYRLINMRQDTIALLMPPDQSETLPDENREDEVHYHAGFHIYIDGELQDFSALEYMNVKPCSLEPDEHDGEDIRELAHLHDTVGTVVHVHAAGITWRGFLGTLLPDTSLENARLYLNGVEVPDALERAIEPYESAVFIIGEAPSDVSEFIENAVTREDILIEEAKPESCGV